MQHIGEGGGEEKIMQHIGGESEKKKIADGR